jgi:protein SCO1
MNRKSYSAGAIAVGLIMFGAQYARADDSAATPMHHHHDMSSHGMTSTVAYTVPDLSLVRADGKSVSLVSEMNDGRPVVLNFIYTSCTSVCPVMSQLLSQFQKELGSERDQVHMMSISIDPEADTPARLADYARQYEAGPQWQFYTGTLDASIAAQRSFDVYRGDKMNHTIVTLMRAAPGKPWQRIDGFVTPDDLLAQYRHVVAGK